MNTQKLQLISMIVGGIFILLSLCVFIVDEKETAIVLQFGQPKKIHTTAGLKIKLPFPIQNVTYYDKRILDVDPQPQRVNISSDQSNNPLIADEKMDAKTIKEVSGEPIIVDTFARYRITDPLLFLQRLRTENFAKQQIENVMDSATRDILGSATLREILSPSRSALMVKIRDRANVEMKPRGVEIVDIRIVRADLTERLQTSTVNRMITERKELATKIRSQGQEKALEIKSTADKERTILLANAQKDAQIIRGEGDKIATETYNKAFNRDPEFYAFTRTMEAYKTSLSDDRTKLILSPDSDFLKYMGNN
jgi:membrane protease subunit HflC